MVLGKRWKNGHGIGKKVAIFDWEWGRNWPLEMGRKSPELFTMCHNEFNHLFLWQL